MPETAAPTLKKCPADDVLFRPSAKKIQANLEMLLGSPTPMTVETGRRFTVEEARNMVPADAVCVVGTTAASDPESEVVVVLDRTVALALSCMLQMQPESAVETRLKSADPFDDAERESAGEVGNFLIAALAERFRDIVGSDCKLAQIPTRFLSGVGAVPVETALPAAGYLGVVGTLKPGIADVGKFVLLVADGLGRAAVARAYLTEEAHVAPAEGAAPPEGTAAGGAATDAAPTKPAAQQAPGRADARPTAATERGGGARGAAGGAAGGAAVDAAPFDATGLVIMTAGLAETTVQRIEAAAPKGATVARKTGIGAVIDAVDGGEKASMVVVEAAAGREHVVDLVGAAKRAPGGRDAAWLIVLARPTRRAVMRCASAGAAGVVPADVPEAFLSERIATILRASARR